MARNCSEHFVSQDMADPFLFFLSETLLQQERIPCTRHNTANYRPEDALVLEGNDVFDAGSVHGAV